MLHPSNPLCSDLLVWAHRYTTFPSQGQILLDAAIPPEGAHSDNRYDTINKTSELPPQLLQGTRSQGNLYLLQLFKGLLAALTKPPPFPGHGDVCGAGALPPSAVQGTAFSTPARDSTGSPHPA